MVCRMCPTNPREDVDPGAVHVGESRWYEWTNLAVSASSTGSSVGFRLEMFDGVCMELLTLFFRTDTDCIPSHWVRAKLTPDK
jgi:hypothetical protein